VICFDLHGYRSKVRGYLRLDKEVGHGKVLVGQHRRVGMLVVNLVAHSLGVSTWREGPTGCPVQQHINLRLYFGHNKPDKGLKAPKGAEYDRN
jgi:hypothetical protein